MRASTKSAIGVITLGVIALSYNIGETAVVTSNLFTAPPIAPPGQPSATPEVPVQPEPGATPSQSASAGANPNTSSSPVTPANPSATASTAPVVKPPTATSKTFDGSAVQSGYGIVQVQVTKTGSKITDINMLQANATNGRSGAFSYLVQYAIDANGANFANISGATYTTDAFKQSLSAALAKF